MDWHLITPEYPPQSGGVSDYTKLVANGFAAAGDEVHVWCPGMGQRSDIGDQTSEIRDQRPEARERNAGDLVVHRDFGDFAPADLRRVGRLLDQFESPRRLLVQWVPHGYGYRSINLLFCLWLWQRAKLKHDRIEIMVHEPFLAFVEGSRKQDMAATVHRLMVVVLLSAASFVWVSIPDWEVQLRPFLLGRRKPFRWLPVPSNIPIVDDPDGVARVRSQYVSPDRFLLGHFGTYDRYLSEVMLELLPSLLSGNDKLSVMLLGRGSLELRRQLIERHPDLQQSVSATGPLSAEDVSRHISACDVMLQPYEDGVSGRRTSAMTAVSHGVPVITTKGSATEDCWIAGEAVKIAKTGDIAAAVTVTRNLLEDAAERRRMSLASRALYEERFQLSHLIVALRQTGLRSMRLPHDCD